MPSWELEQEEEQESLSEPLAEAEAESEAWTPEEQALSRVEELPKLQRLL